jgi:hypothetical protein
MSFLNFQMQILCGFPSVAYENFIELFSGTVTEENLTNQACKVLAQANTPGLLEIFALPRADRYSNPENGSDILPFIYGNTAEQSTGGVSVCPCINTSTFVYCLAAHALPSGAGIVVYADNVRVTSGYVLTLSGDYEGQGVIAYLDFAAKPSGTITMTTTAGRSELTNPIDILADLLLAAGDTTAHNTAAWTRATVDAGALGYVCAGVIAADQPPSFWLSEIMGSFLGSWYLDSSQELVISFDSARLPTGDVAGILH